MNPMARLLQVIREDPVAMRLIAPGGVLLFAVVSVVYRIRSGKGFFRKAHGEVLFQERFGSGNYHGHWYTVLGGARNCLLITLTASELFIRPWFPFNLLFLPEIYGLEHRIALSDITSVKERKNWLLGTTLDIEFHGSRGREERFSLILREKEAFLNALKELKGAAVQ